MARKESKRLSAEEKKGNLLSDLVDVRERILKEASLFSPEMMEVCFVGTWAIRDLLAHLSGWDVTNLEAAKKILKGELPGFYAYHDPDWASYNALLVAKYKRDAFQVLLSLVEETHRELIHFLEEIPASEFFEDRGIRFKGYKVILSRLLDVEKQDEEIHLQQIKEFIESIQPSN
jgi:hypothetical protein